jgi:hypothetical protein
MGSNRAAVQRVLDQTVRSMEGIETPVLRAFMPVLHAAQREVEQELRLWLHSHHGTDTWTAQRYRNALGVINKAIRKGGGDLGDKMEGALKTSAKKLGPMSHANVLREWNAFSHIFEGSVQPLPIDEAIVITRGNKLLWPEFESSAEKYAGSIGEKAKLQLAISRAKGETIHEATNRLQKFLPGVFRNERSDAERLVLTECLTGDTLVDTAVIRSVHRRVYSGPMVDIVTGRGRKFSVTPNHPMLTRRGWVCAGELTECDHLIYDGREKLNPVALYPDVTGSPAKIGEIFDSLAAVGILERHGTGKPDFHGDGMDGQVEIANPHGELSVGVFSPLFEHSLQDVFAPSAFAESFFCDRCHRLLSQQGQRCECPVAHDGSHLSQSHGDGGMADADLGGDRWSATPRLVHCFDFGIDNVVAPLPIFPTSGMEGISGLRQGAGDSGLFDPTEYPQRADVKELGDLDSAVSGHVHLDCVASVRIRQFSGHVFNLSTPYGYFTIDGVYTGNTHHAYNTFHHESILQAHQEDDQICQRWEASYDGRRCPACAYLDGKVVAVDGEFKAEWMQGGKPHVLIREYPPLHPRCRCVLVAWRASWASFANPRSIETLARAAA